MMKGSSFEAQREGPAPKMKAIRSEIWRKRRLKWVFFFISHATSDALNATFSFFERYIYSLTFLSGDTANVFSQKRVSVFEI